MLNSATRDWVEEYSADSIISERELDGGVSSSIHLIELRSGTSLIVRQITEFDSPPRIDEARFEIQNEQRVLRFLDGRALSPRLIASDSSGERCEFPTSLQECLPGVINVDPRNTVSWAEALAKATAEVAAIRLPTTQDLTTVDLTTVDLTAVELTAVDLTTWSPWLPVSSTPPVWVDRSLWGAAFELAQESQPRSHGIRFIHRDLHPANVLFADRRDSEQHRCIGIVDWVHGCVGPVEVDLSRCRAQIAFLTNRGTADLYLELCRELGIVQDYDERWDAVAAVELAPWVEEIAEAYAAIRSPVPSNQIIRELTISLDTARSA